MAEKVYRVVVILQEEDSETGETIELEASGVQDLFDDEGRARDLFYELIDR